MTALLSLNAKAIEYQYMDLVFPMVRQLIEEALIIGIVVVAFGMLRRVALDFSHLGEAHFWQRLVILFIIMVWTASVILNYELYKLELGVSKQALSKEEAHAFANMTLAMIPLELASALLISVMFGTLAFKDYCSDDASARNLRIELTVLPLIGMINHTIYALWFTTVYYFTNRLSLTGNAIDIFKLVDITATPSPVHLPVDWNIAAQLMLVAAYAVLLMFWRLITRFSFYSNHPVMIDWLGTFLYASIIMSLYLGRLGHYIASFHS